MNKVNKDFFKKQWNDFLVQLKLFVKECLPLAFLLNLCIEGFSRQSGFAPFLYAFTSPIVLMKKNTNKVKANITKKLAIKSP